MRHHNWQVTWQCEEPEQLLQAWTAFETVVCRYACWSLQSAPTTLQPHIQGYVEFHDAKTMTAVKEAFGADTMHLEPARGTWKQNKDYILDGTTVAGDHDDTTVEGSFNERGEPGHQGARTDLAAVAANLRNGLSVAEAVVGHEGDFIRYHGGIERYALLQHNAARVEADAPPECWFYTGPTGCGKTWAACALTGWADTFLTNESKWWDGYTQQTTVVMDDWPKPREEDIHRLLRVFDRYPMRCEVKRDYVNVRSKTFIVTSNYAWDVWTENLTPEHRAALARRFNFGRNVKTFTNLWPGLAMN